MKGNRIRVFEVGPRDGLQNESKLVPFSTKLEFVRNLIAAGITDLELGSFVRSDRVPQMADTDRICTKIKNDKLKMGAARAWFLVPNEKGMKRALKGGVTRVALFTAATETFNRKNIGMSIRESLEGMARIIAEAKSQQGKRIHFRGYVSTAFGCPFEGKVTPKQALRVIEKLQLLGVDEVSIGDTIGVTTPAGVDALIRPALDLLGKNKTAVHFHDTRGTALANALRSMELGVETIDSSAGGLGGCPFAPGASGNLATEDLVYMLDGMGLKSGIDLEKLCKASLKLSRKMKRPLSSRYLQTFASRCK